MKKWIAIGIAGLLLVAIVQWIIAALQQNDFQQQIHEWALKVNGTNDSEIKSGLIEAAQKINATVRAEDIRISFAPTDKVSYPQKLVGKIATFENYAATITVEYLQPILWIPFSHRAESWALIQSSSKMKAPREMPEP